MAEICGGCFAETVLNNGVCPRCGFDRAENRRRFPLALEPGTILFGRYIVGRVLGQGGFGITYLTRDHRTGELEALKEYFPAGSAERSGPREVVPIGMEPQQFAAGRDSFLEEAATMARFREVPGVARVYQYFEENGTAYFTMDHVDGVSLESYINQRGGRIGWKEALELLLPVADALVQIHREGVLHRDVTPDNIVVDSGGSVCLLDFGAACPAEQDRGRDVMLKRGFTPREQYTRRGRQGAYTDVFALAATLYYVITGTVPADAVIRSEEDTLVPPSRMGVRITPAQEAVLLRAMAVERENRYQTMEEFAAALRQSLSETGPGWLRRFRKLLGGSLDRANGCEPDGKKEKS